VVHKRRIIKPLKFIAQSPGYSQLFKISRPFISERVQEANSLDNRRAWREHSSVTLSAEGGRHLRNLTPRQGAVRRDQVVLFLVLPCCSGRVPRRGSS